MKRIPNVTPLLKNNQELLAKLNNITKVSFLDKMVLFGNRLVVVNGLGELHTGTKNF